MWVTYKKHIPLIFLAVICAFWGYFYQSTNWLNDCGNSKSELLLLVDGLIVMPLICFFCIENRKEALGKAAVYSCLIIFLGSLVIPDTSKDIWTYLESGRYAILALLVLLEVTAVLTVIFAIKASLQEKQDPDLSISQPIERTLGQSPISRLLSLEARVWTYFLFSKRIDSANFTGDVHFFGKEKDGTQSNMLGFILVIIFEIPLMHALIHFMWSPLAANIISGLTLVSLVFFIAEYKAIALRPISITKDRLFIRYGIWNPRVVLASDIVSVSKNSQFIRRAKHISRYNSSGVPNVRIELLNGNLLYLGLDNPDRFISHLNEKLH